MRNLIVAAVAAALIGCQKPAEMPEQAGAEAGAESALVKSVIDSLNRRFAGLLERGQLDSIGLAYTEDGTALPPNAPAALGREAVKAYWGSVLPLKPSGSIRSEVVTVMGDRAVERGVYTLSVTPPGATAPVTDNGKYLVQWRRVDGKWLIADDIWNSDAPAAPPASK